MKIQEALKKRKKGQTLCSSSISMFRQTKRSLIFWLMLDIHTDKKGKIRQLEKILNAKDWEIENDKATV